MHRDYLSPTDVQIKIFDKSISFFNPGKLYDNLRIEDLKRDNYQARTRNKLIAEAFYLTGEIEKYGSGFIRIREAIKDYPTMQLQIEEMPGGFFSEISYNKQKESKDVTKDVTKNVIKNVTKNVTKDRDAVILGLLEKNPKITTAAIAEEAGVSKRTILRDIEKLRSAGKITYIGPTRNGIWKVQN